MFSVLRNSLWLRAFQRALTVAKLPMIHVVWPSPFQSQTPFSEPSSVVPETRPMAHVKVRTQGSEAATRRLLFSVTSLLRLEFDVTEFVSGNPKARTACSNSRTSPKLVLNNAAVGIPIGVGEWSELIRYAAFPYTRQTTRIARSNCLTKCKNCSVKTTRRNIEL